MFGRKQSKPITPPKFYRETFDNGITVISERVSTHSIRWEVTVKDDEGFTIATYKGNDRIHGNDLDLLYAVYEASPAKYDRMALYYNQKGE